MFCTLTCRIVFKAVLVILSGITFASVIYTANQSAELSALIQSVKNHTSLDFKKLEPVANHLMEIGEATSAPILQSVLMGFILLFTVINICIP